ncbi:hypothetical protein MAP00_005429 [Monascus purpureus]|nr:hypothetical protein MAP00_005429 [Monascus purpureus]
MTEGEKKSIGGVDTSPVLAEGKVVSDKQADVTLKFLEQHDHEFGLITPEKEKKLKWKLYIYILAILIITDLMLFVDKATLSYGSLLGIFESTHINNTQFNNLNTLFYTGYIVAQGPGHYLMQRLPLGPYVGVSVFLWAVIVFLHCVASNYGGLIVLRLLLGAIEASLVPAMEITLGMFFPPDERALLQPLFWTSCLGAPVPAGFIANPSKARFLTTEEKVYTIRRVHESTKSSIEQKVFKPHQFWETVRDPVSWLFGLQAFTLMMANNLNLQQNLIFVQMGVSNLGSTLVSAASGGFSVACSIVAAGLLRLFPNNAAYWGVFWCIPALAGGIATVTVPWHNRIGLLASIIIAGNTFGITYICALGWTTSSTSGHTKKLTRNVIFMAGYGIANIIAPQIWVAKDAPRYYPAWIVQIVISWVGTPVILLIIRFILSRRNKERRQWIAEQAAQGKYGVGYVEETTEDGQVVKVEVDISLLDMTDLENKYFIYPL